MANASAPSVSVVIPARNERSTIEKILNDMERQSYAGSFEVVVADGASTDGTYEFLKSLSEANPYRFSLVVVVNADKTIPAGLNAAVRAARGEYIIRVDCHANVSHDYIEAIVTALQHPGFDLVGPSIRIVPNNESPLAQAIAVLTTSKLGSGGSASRSDLTRPVPTTHAAMSAYRRSVWDAIGGYDELLLTNEDFDFDYRATSTGYGVYSLPSPLFYSMARPTLVSLAKQRWRYGWWKAAVLRKYPESLHLRQAVPMLTFVMMCVAVASIGILPWMLEPVLYAVYLYSAVCVFTALHTLSTLTTWTGGVRTAVTTVVLAPIIYTIIHGVWSAGAVLGLLGNRYSTKKLERQVVR